MRLTDSELETLASKYDVGKVPGYLSYPVMAHWRQRIHERDVIELCRREVEATNGCAYLYFHFPYCQTLCYYCACFMKVTSKPRSRYDAYIEALESELGIKG